MSVCLYGIINLYELEEWSSRALYGSVSVAFKTRIVLEWCSQIASIGGSALSGVISATCQ